jgi:uncharacterized protein YkwD
VHQEIATMSILSTRFLVPIAGAALAVACGACPAWSREPVQTATGVGVSPTESALIAGTNAARARSGLPPLSIDAGLMNGARSHAGRMARSRQLVHGAGVAENIGMGQTSAAEAVSSWMQSSGHRSNMLDPGHTRIGVAVAHAANGVAYWCQQFR